MPQTSTDWAFWVFTTILLGFMLNVAAGLATDPICEILARRRRRTPMTARSKKSDRDFSRTPDAPDELSEEIDVFLKNISPSSRDFSDHDDVLGPPRRGLSDSSWRATTVLLMIFISLYLYLMPTSRYVPPVPPNASVDYLIINTDLLQVGILSASAVLLVVSLILLARYIRRRVDYETQLKHEP